MTIKKQKFRMDVADSLTIVMVLVVFGVFFLFFEVRTLGDSHQHLTQSIAREPVYALFLKYCQILFGEPYFFKVVGFLQNLLAAVSIFYVQKELGKLFRLVPLWRIVAVLLLLAPHLVTPLASNTKFILTNAILTEGITFSLYYIWIIWLLKLLLEPKLEKKHLILSFVGGVVLSLIRGSMMVCILVWGIVLGYRVVRDRQYKRIIVVIIVVALGFAARTVLVRSYNALEQGFFVDTTSGAPMLLANVLYVAEPKDAEGINDPDIKRLFLEIIQNMEQDKQTSKSASGSLLERAKYHERVHDDINFEYLAPVIRGYIEETQGIDGSRFAECMMQLDAVSGKMTQELLPEVAGAFIGNYAVIASLGFVRSIGIEQSVIPIVVVIAYLIGIILSIYLWWNDKKSPSAHFMLLVLLLICANVFATSIMIQCISRYMIYNLPFFYAALGTMLLELRNQKQRR